jgi:hypothetical protein
VDPELEHVLRGLEEAAEFAKTYRFEMTEDYLQLIARVESLAQNRPHTDKSWVWRLIESSARHYARAVPVR